MITIKYIIIIHHQKSRGERSINHGFDGTYFKTITPTTKTL